MWRKLEFALAHFVVQTNAICIIPMNEAAYHVTKNFGIDGAHGAKTAIAVIPMMNGLKADGIYGPDTKAKLEVLLK
ncbi:peptidoglycan-binding domain-containing protein [Bacillus velezensis]|uniref:peptidoglycan-binding domain-containing protein n=1 Tax=Bacillus TaxID=1386 RepID=UPI000450495E|nr:peptidoglycan-binding protein [Bacillus velezensis]EYB36724.1 N-acetylmuramoyl-L-alanine amidase [Bacillus amyloliquefaciens EBL11]QHJ04423.1 hypothetical protein GNE05_14665 [Bacillus sp. AM1(2019)]